MSKKQWLDVRGNGTGLVGITDQIIVRALAHDEHGKACVEIDMGQYYFRLSPEGAHNLAEALLEVALMLDPPR